MNKTAEMCMENEFHQLPESPKRRSQYQKEMLDKERIIIKKVDLFESTKRVLSNSFFWGGQQP